MSDYPDCSLLSFPFVPFRSLSFTVDNCLQRMGIEAAPITKYNGLLAASSSNLDVS